MYSELQWFSDQRFALCLREELLVTCMFRCIFLYGFLILRLGLRLREVIVLMHFYMMQWNRVGIQECSYSGKIKDITDLMWL